MLYEDMSPFCPLVCFATIRYAVIRFVSTGSCNHVSVLQTDDSILRVFLFGGILVTPCFCSQQTDAH